MPVILRKFLSIRHPIKGTNNACARQEYVIPLDTKERKCKCSLDNIIIDQDKQSPNFMRYDKAENRAVGREK